MTKESQELLQRFGRLFQERPFVGEAFRSLRFSGDTQASQHHRGPGRVLRLLNDKGELTNAEIGEALDIRPSSVTALVNRLEEAGLVARTTSEADGRVVHISLSDAGRERIADVQKRQDETADYLFAALSADEQAQLSAILDKLTKDLQAKLPEASTPEFGGPRGWHRG